MNVIPRTLVHAVRNPDLKAGIEIKVLTDLHESLNVGQFKPVFSWIIEQRLKVDRSSVTRALAHLEELGYLERGEPHGNSFTYRLTMPANGQNHPPPSENAA